jgi:hypothetical protein
MRDPFALLGLDTVGKTDARPATKKQLAELAAFGVDATFDVTRSSAADLTAELARRKKEGLCSLKQSRQLAQRGLRQDLTAAEAGKVMGMLAAADWKTTPELAEKYGA